MATSTDQEVLTTQPTTASEPQAAAGASREEQPSQRPVEMSNLDTTYNTAPAPTTPDAAVAAAAGAEDPRAAAPGSSETSDQPSALTFKLPATHQHAPLNRTETAEALGPSDTPAPATDPSTPTLRITLMLTTGSRHAYTITQKYLTSRKVEAKDAKGDFEPREMSGYKLKELIWTDWRPEWEPRPRDPSSIRLIIMGRMIDDKIELKDLPFTLAAANVVHMTIKPADLQEDEAEGAGKGGKGSIRAHNAGDEGGAGCRCVIL